MPALARTLLLSAVALGLGAFALQWLEYQHVARSFSTELYIVLIALAFTALGAWTGHKLTRRDPPAPFARNEAALRTLGVTEREAQVLGLLAAGKSNKEIAAALGVSQHTVKTHIGHLFEKLEARRRTEAIHKARALRLIP